MAAFLHLCRGGVGAVRAERLALGLVPIHEQFAVDRAFEVLDAQRHDFRLSAQQNEFLRLLSDGLTQKEAASRMGITDNTVDTYRRRILKATGARTIAQALAIYTALAKVGNP